MENIKNFGPNLRSLIDKSPYKTYKKAADAFGISLSYLNQLMRNEREPSLEMLNTIADELGVSRSELLDGPQKIDIATPDRASRILALQSTLLNMTEEQFQNLEESIEHILNPIELEDEEDSKSSKVK